MGRFVDITPVDFSLVPRTAVMKRRTRAYLGNHQGCPKALVWTQRYGEAAR